MSPTPVSACVVNANRYLPIMNTRDSVNVWYIDVINFVDSKPKAIGSPTQHVLKRLP